MSRLFTCGFEEDNLTATMWNAATVPTGAFDTGNFHSGARSYSMVGSVTVGDNIDRNITTKTTGSLFVRCYIGWVSAVPTTHQFMCAISSGNAFSWAVQMSGGVLRLRNSVLSANTDGAFTGWQVGVWYRLEIRHLLSDTVGELELRLYEGESTTPIETLTRTAEDTLNTNVNRIRFGSRGTGSGTTHYDSIAINNEAGSVHNSWAGPGKITMLVPTSDVSVAMTPNPGGGGNFVNVNDLPGAPDDDTTYNASAVANTEDRYGITDMPSQCPANAIMKMFDVYSRVRGEGTTGTRQCRCLVWDQGGTQANGPTTNNNDNTAYAIDDDVEHFPVDISTNTKANIDSWDIGYEPITSHATRVTALWVNVEWQDPDVSLVPSPPIAPGALAMLVR